MSRGALRDILEQALAGMGVTGHEVRLERPRDPDHGDIASSVALTLASRLRRPPRAIADEIAGRLELDGTGIASVEVAGPGFLNFRLSASRVSSVVVEILRRGELYGRSGDGRGRAIMVEFVSANPTGPLHLGHGRQAALGDTLANLLDWTGWAAYREYYYNDAGRQIERLGESVACRYLHHFGVQADFPDDGYHGAYVVEIAERLAQAEGDRWVDAEPEERHAACRRFAVRVLREEQDRDLAHFGVRFDRYFLESSLYTDGAVDATIAALRETGHVYDRDGAMWLTTTAFGDQKDRVMVKSDGSPTYFLPDVAYHMSKWRRGFHEVINVQGSDHHGTVDRVRAGLQALGRPRGYPEYLLHQMVTVERSGVEVKLSKRSGGYTTLRELVEAVGVDVARYFFLMRKPEAHLVFDLDAALDHSDRNPVYKSKYAHARMCSIFRKAGMDPDSMTPDQLAPEDIDLSLLEHPRERELMGRLGEFPELVRRAARARAPHLVCEYLEHTSGMVNSWYHAGNPTRNPDLAVLAGDPALRAARLALTGAVRVVLRNALTLVGVEAPTRMARRVN